MVPIEESLSTIKDSHSPLAPLDLIKFRPKVRVLIALLPHHGIEVLPRQGEVVDIKQMVTGEAKVQATLMGGDRDLMENMAKNPPIIKSPRRGI